MKRCLDIAVSSVALVLLAPLMAVVAVLIRSCMGGPVIFRQERIGLNCSTFVCYKFRTMAVNADDVLRRHLAANPNAAKEWLDTQKLRDDPRVSRLGSILRKASLDELPQLINVLRGEMSCVGPRPIVRAELARYGERGAECFSTRPGITGIWQTNGRNSLGYADRIALDRYYVQHWSIWFDLLLLMKTVPAVVKFSQTS